MAPRTPDMQRQQSGFTALDSLRNNQVGLKLPDFSRNNQFQGNPMAQASSGLGGSPTSFAANPFSMTGGAAAASANLPSFGGGGAMGGGGGGAGSAIAASAQKIVASNEKLVAALNNLAAKLGGAQPGGPGGSPGGPGGPSPGGGMGLGGAFGGAVGKGMGALAAVGVIGGMASSLTSSIMTPSVMRAQQGAFNAGNSLAQSQAGFNIMSAGLSMGGMQTTFASLEAERAAARAGAGGRGASLINEGMTDLSSGFARLGPLSSAHNALAQSRIAQGQALRDQEMAQARQKALDEGPSETDIAIFNANARGAVRGTTSISSYFQGRAAFPGSSEASAVQRASRFRRTARQFALLSQIGNETIQPMEQAGFEFMANVSMHSGRYTRFLDAQGRANMREFLGGDDASVTTMSGLFGNALGMSNITATQEMNSIVGAQGFRGIEHTQLNGTIDRALMRPKNAKERKALREIIKAGDPDGRLVRGVRNLTFLPPGQTRRPGIFMQDELAEMAATPFATAESNINGAFARQAAAYGRAPLEFTSAGSLTDRNVLAAGTNDLRDPALLRRNNHNRAMGIDEVINARQRGFSAATIGMAGQIGRGGMGGMHSAGGSDLLNEAAFLDLRGAGAQQHIQGRINFFSRMAQQGFNPATGGFTMETGGLATIGLIGPGAPMLFQRGFSNNQMQMEGEINTVINRGRARRLQSFMGGNFGARAGEMRGFAESGAQSIKGILGGFGQDVLMAQVLAENNGDIAQSMRAMHGMGPLSARNRLQAAGFSGQGLRDALLSLEGMSPDTVDTILQAPNRLENLSQKRRDTLQSMGEKTVGAAKAEKEIQRMEAFNHNTFRMMTAAEANKEANEVSKTSLKNIESFLKETFSTGKKKKKPPTPPPPGASDIRLKKAITFLRKSLSGINIYSFVYKNDKTETIWEGVMAQEIMHDYPEAVILDTDGYYKVYYDKIDVDMKRIK